MAEEAPKPAAPERKKWVYAALVGGTAVATFLVLLLWENILVRKEEARRHVFKIVNVTEDTIDPAEWGKNFPRQYDSYRRTVDIERTRHGGSDAFQKLDEDPAWREIFKGYAFGVDYREERGHAYMLSDQDMTERVKQFKQPGACLHCHSSVLPAYRKAGNGDVMKGFEAVCAMPYAEARKLVTHPVSCIDCHTPESMELRVTRPAFLNGMKALAKSDDPLPHLPSVERWRKGRRDREYDPNVEASRQEMRSLVCAQCHVEYYFKGDGKLVTYPWDKGLKVEQIEKHYDEAGYKEWTHARTGAGVLKAQHPEFELWSQGIHARSGVACADCHMPYKREGAIKISDHHVRSPLLDVSKSCMTCHRYTETEVDKLVKAGKGVYEQQCQVCHGASGEGNGPAADLLPTRPRNFTRGMYKFRTSIPDEMPFDDDLYRTISSGIPAAGMPSFGDLTPFERWALVAYVKSLTRFKVDDETTVEYFKEFPAKTKVKLPPPPEPSKIDLKRGEALYRSDIKCMQCHGEKGVGDGPSAKGLTDSLGFPIVPTDLTRGEVTFRAGSKPEDIYRVLTTGMPGTPMPSFATLSEGDRWNLAYYVTSLYRPIEPGERVYLKVGCTSCHTVGKGKLIGPDLAGVMLRRDRAWMKKWLKDPPSMLATDETARKLLEEYLTPMPSYGLTDREVDLLIQYLETLK